MKILAIALFIHFVHFSQVYAQDSNDHELFRIERSRDANKIYYTVNLDKNGTLDQDNPIEVYWIKHANHDEKEPLTWIQTKMAYGLQYINISNNEVEFRFVSYKSRTLTLRKTNSDYAVFIQSEQNQVQLERIFIHIDGGSFFFPSIPYVKLHGIDPKTNLKIQETIIP